MEGQRDVVGWVVIVIGKWDLRNALCANIRISPCHPLIGFDCMALSLYLAKSHCLAFFLVGLCVLKTYRKNSIPSLYHFTEFKVCPPMWYVQVRFTISFTSATSGTDIVVNWMPATEKIYIRVCVKRVTVDENLGQEAQLSFRARGMRREISGCETGEATTRVNCMCRMRINVMLDLAWHTRRAFLSIITCGWDGM